MKKIYFIRHGLSLSNVQGLISGRTNPPLTDEGREQARLAGLEAKKLSIDGIVSSPLIRAKETAEIIAKEINHPLDKIYYSPLFLERSFGVLENETYSPDINIEEVEGVESLEEILKRASKAIDWINSLSENNVLIVSHGSFGRALRHQLMEDYPFYHPTRFKNADIVRLV